MLEKYVNLNLSCGFSLTRRQIAPLALRGMLTAACAIAFTVGPFIVALIVNSTGNEPARWAYRATFVAQYGFSGLGAILLPFAPE
jgi:MFS transporter, SP family, general alpha glucoside:H+ symporter